MPCLQFYNRRKSFILLTKIKNISLRLILLKILKILNSGVFQKQSLIYNNKEAYLGNIHFIIFCNLLLHREDGSDKTDLYKEIWPQDKEYQFNKLDTHLTNLKNHLKENINFDFLFFTRSGLIYIRVD